MEVAAAGEDDGEEAAVVGEAEFADGEAVEEHARGGLGDGDGLARGVGGERRDGKFGEVGGFFFDGALEVDAGFIGGPLENPKADAEACDFVGGGEVANFENFIVEIVGDFGAGRREGEAAGKGIEGGDFGGVLRERVRDAGGARDRRGCGCVRRRWRNCCRGCAWRRGRYGLQRLFRRGRWKH